MKIKFYEYWYHYLFGRYCNSINSILKTMDDFMDYMTDDEFCSYIRQLHYYISRIEHYRKDRLS